MWDPIEVSYDYLEKDFLMFNQEVGKYVNKQFKFYISVSIVVAIVGGGIMGLRLSHQQGETLLSQMSSLMVGVSFMGGIWLLFHKKIQSNALKKAYHNEGNRAFKERHTLRMSPQNVRHEIGNGVTIYYTWLDFEAVYESAQVIYLMVNQGRGIFLIKSKLSLEDQLLIKAWIEEKSSLVIQEIISKN